jgi:hypothetical protein
MTETRAAAALEGRGQVTELLGSVLAGMSDAELQSLLHKSRVGLSRSPDLGRMVTEVSGLRGLVLERDGYACVCCGQSVIDQAYSIRLRKPASQGGKAVPENLITLLGRGCESHRGRVELCRDPADAVKGYRLSAGQDPLLVPVSYGRPAGPARFWLLADGTRTAAPPDGAT